MDSLTVTIEPDDIVTAACRPFDYVFDGTSTFTPPHFDAPRRDGSWKIGLIVGPSGSGKSTLLKNNYGEQTAHVWDDNRAIVSHFSSADDATRRLCGVGLNSIPTWCRPFRVLSTGEAFRANLARSIENNASIDEFTSVVDRVVAKTTCVAVRRLIESSDISGVVFATCHYDVIEWLRPDWVFNTLATVIQSGRSLQRPPIQIDIRQCERRWWNVFKAHHYLRNDLSPASRCWIGYWNDTPVAFASSMPLPSGTTRNAWREHRTVVLPDYQGVGIGVRVSDEVAQIHVDEGRKYYSKTAHPRMGEYRDRSPLWKPTKHNRKIAKYKNGTMTDWVTRSGVYLYSHQYVGRAILQSCK